VSRGKKNLTKGRGSVKYEPQHAGGGRHRRRDKQREQLDASPRVIGMPPKSTCPLLPLGAGSATGSLIADGGVFAEVVVVAASRQGRAHSHLARQREDAFAVTATEDGAWVIAALADGVGGSPHAHRAATAAVQAGTEICRDRLRQGTFRIDWTAVMTEVAASLGHLYSAATVACGLRPQCDEGKLTAMAATGSPHARLLTRLRELVVCTDGRLHGSLSRGIVQGPYPDRVPAFHNEAMAAMIEGIDRDDVAATVQLVLEEAVLALVTHHLKKSGVGVLVASGGVFANVSLNRRVADLPCVDELHVHPGMTDAGIAMGAAAAAYAAVHHRRPMPLHNIGLGPAYPDDDAVGTFIGRGYRLSDSDLPAESQIAAALAEGRIAARFVGGCEYGPRALGHRSVLAPAGDVRTANELNEPFRVTSGDVE
jgi:predicted NodU family carbamoyl transferase